VQPYPVVCGDGVKQLANAEECDPGAALLGEYGACNDLCLCTSGFVVDELTDGCICNPSQPHRAVIEAVETSAVAGAPNNVTLAVQLESGVLGLDGAGMLPEPVVVTVSGLSGASANGALDGLVPIECWHAEREVWTVTEGNKTREACMLGVAPASGSSAWRLAHAHWSELEGTLKFTVLADLPDEKLLRFYLTVPLLNSERVQDTRRPSVSICEHRPADAAPNYAALGLYESELARGRLILGSNGYILGSNAKALDASDVTQTFEFTKRVGTRDRTVLKVTVPGGAMPDGSELIVYSPESHIDKGLTNRMARRLPYRDTSDVEEGITALLAGARMLELRLQNKLTKEVVPFVADVEVEMTVDQAVLRQRGSCYTPESSTVTVCLPGYAGIFKYVDSEARHEWQFLPDVRQPAAAHGPSHQTRVYQTLISEIKAGDVTASSAYALLAVSPCNDYQGAGRAGGDQVCRKDGDAAGSEAYAVLGAGTISKMPSIASTSRPAQVDSQDSLSAYLADLSADNVEFLPRKNWTRVDLSSYPTAAASFTPRFGHAMACVSGTRVLIYGGIGCASRDPSSGFCSRTVLLNDL